MAVVVIPPLLEAAAWVIGLLFVNEAAKQAIKKPAQDTAPADPDPEEKPPAQPKPVPAPVLPDYKKKCNQCPPDCGVTSTESTAGWPQASIEYQHRICGLPYGDDWITEWLYQGVRFDGFDSSQCLLKEAKGNYDFFFNANAIPEPWASKLIDKMTTQAARQFVVAVPNPPVRLAWFFMQSLSYSYFSRIFRKAFPTIETRFQP